MCLAEISTVADVERKIDTSCGSFCVIDYLSICYLAVWYKDRLVVKGNYLSIEYSDITDSPYRVIKLYDISCGERLCKKDYKTAAEI